MQPAVRSSAIAGRTSRLGNATLSSVKQATRPFLEDFLKLRFPARFVNGEQISEIQKAIKDAGVDDPLYSSAEALIALDEFSRPNMHGGAAARLRPERKFRPKTRIHRAGEK